MRPNQSRLSSLARILGWNSLLILLVILAAEAIFGGWLDSIRAPALWRLGIYRNVDWTFYVAGIYGRTEPATYHRDGFGLRGRYGTPDKVNIVVIGGSTTDERFISEGETWVDRFQSCLNADGRAAHVANAAVSGQSTRGHATIFSSWLSHIPGLKPAHVIAYIGVNERQLELRETWDDIKRYNEGNWPLWLERIKLNSALYAFYKTIAGNVAAWRAGFHHATTSNGVPGETAATAMDRIWRGASAQSLLLGSPEHERGLREMQAAHQGELQAYVARLTRLTEDIQRFGAEPILVTQPLGQFRIRDGAVHGSVSAYLSMDAFNAITLAFCKGNRLRCVDLGNTIEISDGDFYDNVHTTPSGSHKIGELICRNLLSDPAFPARR